MVWFRPRLFAYGPQSPCASHVVRVLIVFNPKNRSTLLASSSHGTDISCITLKRCSSKSAVSKERPPTGIGHKVPLARLPSQHHHRANHINFYLEAYDTCNSPFFDPSPNGVGGWGDPNNDYQIHNGGFKDWVRAYPSPHGIRRNCSILPFRNPAPPPPFGNPPDAPPRPVDLMVNVTMTKQNVDYIVNNFEGDYFKFQGYFESLNVS